MKYVPFSELVGKTLTSVENNTDEVIFVTSEEEKYKLYHEQDCCENVTVDDVVGDLNDLIGSPILMAEEVSGDSGEIEQWGDHYTWTFYKLATVKGYVTIKWYGTSNGYYSESVSFAEV